MDILFPSVVGDAELISTNVLETAPAAWSSVVTYGLGDQRSTWSGTTATIWESLQAANTNHSPASSPTWWKQISVTYAEFDPLQVYVQGDRVVNLTTHKIYESAVDSNVGQDLEDEAWWLFAGSTNPWAMFDTVNGSASVRQGVIDVTVRPTGRIDGMAIVGVNAASVQIIVTSDIDGVVYDETYSLVSTDSISTWWDYYFEEIVRKTKAAYTDFPPYMAPTIQVILTSETDDVACGSIVFGQRKFIGDTELGLQFGIQDYSKTLADEFGNYNLIQRQYSDTQEATVWIEKEKVDEVKRKLTDYRAKPLLFIGHDGYESSIIFGFIKGHRTEVAHHNFSILTIQIEGFN